ncbi:MAG: putative Ig domain-containing protein [Balneolales bacterium]
MEVPDIKAVTSSDAHMFVLSEREGLIVFRTSADSLQWLYTSSGLANRGDHLVTDIRFSYLFGRNQRLTVIEPTSVLGVYSSTRLSFDPGDVVRINNDLFLSDYQYGIRKLSLDSPESVDRNPESAFQHDQPFISLSRISNRLFALDDQNRLFLFEYRNGELSNKTEYRLPSNSSRLHTIGNSLYVTTDNGSVHRIRTDGRSDELFKIDEPVTHLVNWNNNYFIRGESNRIWIARQGLSPTLFRDDATAGNHITTFKDQLWISDFQQLSRWQDTGDVAIFNNENGQDEGAVSRPGQNTSEILRVTEIDNQIIPYPRPLILPLSLESSHNMQEVRFQQRSNINGISIRGNSLYWQPSSSHVGTHAISLIANTPDGQSDSTSFSVTVRPFNSPPRFSPVRQLSIPVNEEFTIPFQASDPDGSDSNMIRYIGVDLPENASLNERSGQFEWIPTRRQTGEHTFQVIATDQYGAASSLDIKINVINLQRGDS